MKGHGAYIIFWMLVVFIGLVYLGNTVGPSTIEGLSNGDSDSSSCAKDKKHHGDKRRKRHRKHHHHKKKNTDYSSDGSSDGSASDGDNWGIDKDWDSARNSIENDWDSGKDWVWNEVTGQGGSKHKKHHHKHGGDSKIQKDTNAPAPVNSDGYDDGTNSGSDVTQSSSKVATHQSVLGGDSSTWGPPLGSARAKAHKSSRRALGGDPNTWGPPQQYRGAGSSGIPSHMIPTGDEDLYILKSEIVPPVCPACPAVTACPGKQECEPCPPCGRCPEAPFECKKVPNYRAANSSYLPMPVLNDFSQFGM